ncbi:MAG TPA: phytanoyl-CoA dioxygenase family protein [Burkholderiales bacterium]|nr:phytanoyl-CoA dioxygenase family protein [Burkholderiales bacterium]
MIDDKQVRFYRDNGYIVVENVIDPDTVSRIKGVIAEFVAKAKGLTTHNEVYDLEPTHSPDSPRVRRIKTPHKWHPIFWEIVKSPKMVAILKALLGPNVRLHGSKLNMKSPQYGSPVEWHQDWAFYPHTNDDLLAIGVMLDDVELENGPLLVMPGTHRVPKVWDHHLDGRFCGAMDPANTPDLDYSRAVACTGRAGSCSFHHVRLVHGSAQNTSVKPRNLLLYECAAADAWPLTALNFGGLDDFNSRMICGEPTLEARLEKVPVRMPYPPALAQGSIYENQTALRNRFFEIKQAAT